MTDLAIIGAGPAGMAAAATAAQAGLSVVLLDENPGPGGQIYRDVDRAGPLRGEILGAEFGHGTALTGALDHGKIDYINAATVWSVEDGWRISYTRNGAAAQVQAERVVLATGALERAMPLPGWTLPGVMTVGAAQILLKHSGILPRRAVLVGSGPLLWLLAAQMVRAGVVPLALVETQTRADLGRALKHLPAGLRGWPYLTRGLRLLREIRRAGVPRYLGATDIAIDGPGMAETVSFYRNGKAHRLSCDTVLLHHGVVPNTQAARSLDIPHLWSDQQQCFVPVVDAWGESGRAGVYIAGDSAGIGGAEVAEHAGRLSALKIAADLGRISDSERDRQARPLQDLLRKHRAIRPFLDRAYPPFAGALHPADSTLICRCEDVTAGDIRSYARLGCLGPNQTKAFGRVGMGPCQGRYCGLAVTTLLAAANGSGPDQTGYYRIRPPLKPVTLGELAAMEAADQPG